jgi:hypothetical protein
MGTVVGFEWPESAAVYEPERQPTAIKVLFENKRVWQNARQFTREMDGIVEDDVSHSPVIITPATAKFLDEKWRTQCITSWVLYHIPDFPRLKLYETVRLPVISFLLYPVSSFTSFPSFPSSISLSTPIPSFPSFPSFPSCISFSTLSRVTRLPPTDPALKVSHLYLNPEPYALNGLPQRESELLKP